MGANTRQIAGEHYVKFGKFQVWDAWWHWGLDAFQANIIKYVVRKKGGLKKRLEDLDKAVHYVDKYKELLIENTHPRRRVSLFEINKGPFPMWEAWKQWDLDPFQASMVERVVCSNGSLADTIEDLVLVGQCIDKYKEIVTEQEAAAQQQQEKEIVIAPPDTILSFQYGIGTLGTTHDKIPAQ